ncbi:winged helix-turn-helix domain-containing protein [Methanolobus sp. ZRKC2]|uniref:helix-turn-helix transcriptional regulator n=1 Tax=Methanolobus sp. ZRKC2 TaxID=3125783 RepID=UPI00324E5D20
MKIPLLETLGICEDRMNLLLLLYNGPMKKRKILESLEISSQALVPTIRTFEHNNIVVNHDGTYELTSIGKLIVDEIIPFLETLEFLESNFDYLAEHKLDFIPFYLLKRLRELYPYTILRPTFSETLEFNKQLEETTDASKTFYIVTSLLLPSFPAFFSKWISEGVEISMIVSEELFEKIQSNNLLFFNELLAKEQMDFLVYPGNMGFQNFILNDYCFSWHLLSKTGNVSGEQLISCNQNALEWGKELFEYYKQCSNPVTSI